METLGNVFPHKLAHRILAIKPRVSSAQGTSKIYPTEIEYLLGRTFLLELRNMVACVVKGVLHVSFPNFRFLLAETSDVD